MIKKKDIDKLFEVIEELFLCGRVFNGKIIKNMKFFKI